MFSNGFFRFMPVITLNPFKCKYSVLFGIHIVAEFNIVNLILNFVFAVPTLPLISSMGLSPNTKNLFSRLSV